MHVVNCIEGSNPFLSALTFPEKFIRVFLLSMKQITTFECSPEDLRIIISEAIKPFVLELAELRAKVRQQRSVLTVAQIAEDCGRSADTIRTWIQKGRNPPGKSKKVKLKIVDGLSDGPYMIRWEDYQDFLYHFPSVQISV